VAPGLLLGLGSGSDEFLIVVLLWANVGAEQPISEDLHSFECL
jgi:hypothetical protein